MNSAATGLGALILLAVSCKTTSPMDSEVAHDRGRYTSDISPFQWEGVPREKALVRMNLWEDDVLGPEHPATRRLQKWVDALDAAVKAHLPGDLSRNIPTPKVLVLKDESINAHVAPFFYETSAPVVFGSASGSLIKPHLPFAYTLYDRYTDRLISEASPLELLKTRLALYGDREKPALDEADMIPWIQWNLSQRAGPGCDLKSIVKSFGSFIVPKGCARTEELRRFIKTPLKLSRMANWIFVNIGTMKDLKEGWTVWIIAHELAHYYRAHALSPKRDYCYDYLLGDKNPSCKPPQDDAVKSLLAKVEEATDYGWASGSSWTDNEKSLEYYLDTYVFAALDGAIPRFEDGAYNLDKQFSELAKVCPSYVRFLIQLANTSGDGDQVVEPRLRMGAEEAGRLRRQCTKSIPMKGPAGQEFRRFWSKLEPRWTMHTNNLKPAADVDLDGYLRQVADAMAEYEAGVYEARREIPHLGYYTQEQEADELGLELAVKVGISPRDAIDGLFAIFNDSPRTQHAARLCRKLYENAWRDPATGTSAKIGIGGKTDDHHELCFRIRNLDREADAHGWASDNVGDPAFPLLSLEEWSRLSKRY